MHRLTFVSTMPPLIQNFIIDPFLLYFLYPVFYPKVLEVVSSHLNCGSGLDYRLNCSVLECQHFFNLVQNAKHETFEIPFILSCLL